MVWCDGSLRRLGDKVKKRISIESTTIFHDARVVKSFTPKYFELNEEYGRRGEAFWCKELVGDSFLKPLEIHETHITFPRIGQAMGDDLGFGDISPLEIVRLLNWLTSMMADLERNGVDHHDIHPGNILRDGESFKLIDMAWMQWSREEPRCLEYLNLEYSTDDTRAKMQMFCQLERMLRKK